MRFFNDFCGKFFRMPAFAGMTSFRQKPESGVSAKQIEEPKMKWNLLLKFFNAMKNGEP